MSGECLRIDPRWWLDSQGRGPKESAGEIVWEAVVAISLRIDAIDGNGPNFIAPVVAGTIQFDGEDFRRRLHQITVNLAGLPADDVLVLLTAIHDMHGIPDDDDMDSRPVALGAWLRPVFGRRSVEVANVLRGYTDRLFRDGLRLKGRLYTCVPA
ncbi:MAG: hypothetical protein ACAI43_13065 [Phycisphaerae bacterium]|nr:hypothetical protein [Tepidisphaeraceae bacterium]